MLPTFTVGAVKAFPSDLVPDGAVFGPHHLYIGLLLALLAVAIVWDDAANREPWVGAAALLAAAFSFATVWKFYPVTGALLSIVALLIAVLAPMLLPFWREYALIGPRGVALLGALIALDDVAEHAFGIPTPLDWLWKTHLVQHIH